MKIKTPTEFQTFTDGACDVYSVSGNRLGDKIRTVPFGAQTTTYQRYYAARAASTRIDRVIRIPMYSDVDDTRNLVIGHERYKIEQAQPLFDTNPPCIILSIRRVGVIADV